MEFILAQIFGGIALVLVCIGYFFKTKSALMIIQIIANFFYAGAFFVVGSYVGAGLTMISLLRCVYLYFAEKKHFKYTLHMLPIFIILYTTITIIFWNNAFDIMSLIASVIFTIGFAIKNLQTMRYVLIFPNAILVVYNIITTTYASALLDFIETIVIIVAIVKFYFNNKKTKTTDKEEKENS